MHFSCASNTALLSQFLQKHIRKIQSKCGPCPRAERQGCTFGRRLAVAIPPKVHSQNADYTPVNEQYFENRVTPFARQSIYPFVSKLPMSSRIVLQIDKIYPIFKNIARFTCVCAFFVVPLHPNWLKRTFMYYTYSVP